MSTTPIKDGGPAFPVPLAAITDANGTMHVFHPQDRCIGGMSLRDYFAGQALAGILAGRKLPLDQAEPGSESDMSESAYVIANAMIKARDAGGAK